MKDLTCNDSVLLILAQVIDEMKSQQGDSFSIKKINLAELQRRTRISRQRLRTLQKNGFKNIPVQRKPAVKPSVIEGYSAIIDNLLKQGVTNSSVCFDRISEFGYLVYVSSFEKILF